MPQAGRTDNHQTPFLPTLSPRAAVDHPEWDHAETWTSETKSKPIAFALRFVLRSLSVHLAMGSHILCSSTGTGMVNCSGRWVKTNKRINNDNNSYQSCQLVAHCLQTIAQWCWWLVWGCRVDVQSSALSCLSLRPLSATDNNLSPSSKNYFINFIKKYSAPSLLVSVVNATRRM